MNVCARLCSFAGAGSWWIPRRIAVTAKSGLAVGNEGCCKIRIWSRRIFGERYSGYVALSANRELWVTQTRYLQNVAYIRLKNLSLAYDIPASTLQHVHIQALKVYFTGQNIWTHSPLYKHTQAFDPEVIGADPSGGSGSGNDYPMLKSYTLGLNLTF